MYTRHITPLLQEALADTPVVLLNGARQTGKSTLIQSLAASEGRRYFTLDDQAVLAAATSDPAGFIAGINGAVALDEVQRAPALFLAIKAAVDRDRQAGRFLLTGSANVMLLPNIADSLAGRMEVLSLWPLSSAEIGGDAAYYWTNFDAEYMKMMLLTNLDAFKTEGDKAVEKVKKRATFFDWKKAADEYLNLYK